MAENDGNWLTIAQAAVKLNVSARTIYRRVDNGDLPKKQVDGHTLVFVKDDQPNVSQMSDQVTIARLEAERDALARDVTRLEEMNQVKTSEIDHLRQTLQNEQSNLMAMMANHQKLIEAQTTPPPATPPEPPGPARPGPKWWQFWR